MKTFAMRTGTAFVVGAALALGAGAPATADAAPKRGGILKYVVPAEPPSFDGHRETR
jgi:peptide/nickel transport system substrate-binding protein